MGRVTSEFPRGGVVSTALSRYVVTSPSVPPAGAGVGRGGEEGKQRRTMEYMKVSDVFCLWKWTQVMFWIKTNVVLW